MLPNIFFLKRREFLKKSSVEASSSRLCGQKKPRLLCTFKQQTINNKSIEVSGVKKPTLPGNELLSTCFDKDGLKKKRRRKKSKKNRTHTRARTCTPTPTHTHTDTHIQTLTLEGRVSSSCWVWSSSSLHLPA